MSNDCLFKTQINSTIGKVKNIISWILRTFSSRSPTAMLTLYKSLVIPILEYCSVLWNPTAVGHIQQLETVQQSFVRKINGSNNDKNYWERLKEMNMYSLQRRRERYQVIYTWKILENIPNVPNINGSIKSKENPRLGRTCVIQSPSMKLKKIRDGAYTSQGPRLFNCLPKEIRNLSKVSLEQFKRSLDKYLKTVPDEPQIAGYTSCRRASSNSITNISKLVSAGFNFPYRTPADVVWY